MGLHSLDNIMDTVEDVNMRAHLRAEHTQYAEINERAAQQLARQAAKPDSIGPMAKMASDVSTKMNTLIDLSLIHIYPIGRRSPSSRKRMLRTICSASRRPNCLLYTSRCV